MFGIDTNILLFMILAALGGGGLIYGLLYDRVSSEVKTEKRLKNIQERERGKRSAAAARITDAAKRKKTVQDSLKDLEEKQKAKHNKKLTLKRQMQQAGLSWSVRQFVLLSVAVGLFLVVVTFLAGLNIMVVMAAGVVGALGVPRWIVARMRKRRMAKFLNEFPNAVDVMVRGVKAGLPINDCLAIIAREAKEPVSTEFARVIEAQQMGLPLSEAIGRLYDNMPLPESNFFGIVIAIQQSAGGNLSEALGNLAVVLRDRKKMKEKINAMSMEAKTSAGIIGALPFLVAFLVYITTPDYIKILWTDQTGNIILICSGLWMGIGIMVMKKMINFDF